MPNVVSYLAQLQADYENAITTGGKPAVNSLITSKRLINHIHEYIKDELVANGINPKKIYPPQGATKPELKMQGFLKPKNPKIFQYTSSTWYQFSLFTKDNEMPI